MNTALITNVQRFSPDDGPGIRTTVFFKGCPLSCRWCHNPECLSFRPQVLYSAEACTLCRRCEAACPRGVHRFEGGVHRMERSLCTGCGRCAEACWSGALEPAGKPVAREELIALLLRDRAYYEKSGGGVTFSGGEPALQAEYLLPVLQQLQREGVRVALDTCGHVPRENYEKLLPYTGLFLYDIKAMDPALHKELTGQDNALILENLRFLDGAGVPLWVRMPLVKGLNDAAPLTDAAAELLSGLKSLRRVDLLPFHSYGIKKYGELGMPCPGANLEPPDPAALAKIKERFLQRGLPVFCTLPDGTAL